MGETFGQFDDAFHCSRCLGTAGKRARSLLIDRQTYIPAYDAYTGY